MTPAQAIKQLRQEFAMNERLAELFQAVAKTYADEQLRSTYSHPDHASLLRLTGAAAGVESFAKLVTGAPQDRPPKD